LAQCSTAQPRSSPACCGFFDGTPACACCTSCNCLEPGLSNLMERPMTVSIPVPEGSVPGTLLHHQMPNGRVLDITVPEGVPPGSTLLLTQDLDTKAWNAEVGQPSVETEEVTNIATAHTVGAPVEMPVSFTVAVPEAAVPGSSFPCRTPNGQELDLTVPPGVPPGTLLTLTLDPATKKWSCEVEVGGGSSPSRPATPSTATAPSTTSVVVPCGAGPGSLLRHTTPEGQELDLIIPEGVLPGSRLTLTRDPATGTWNCTADHTISSTEQSGAADAAIEATPRAAPAALAPVADEVISTPPSNKGDSLRHPDVSVLIPDKQKFGTSAARGNDPQTPTWGFRGDTEDLAGCASQVQVEPPPPCQQPGYAGADSVAASDTPTVASPSGAPLTSLPQSTTVQLQSTEQHPQQNRQQQHPQQHVQQQQQQQDWQQHQPQQESVPPAEAETGEVAQGDPSLPPPLQPSPAQVPPRYCTLHDSSSKRTKAVPRLWQCSLCGIRVQTNYAEFALCALCSDKESKCMICSNSAPRAGTYIPAQRLPEMQRMPEATAGQGEPSLDPEVPHPGAVQQQLSYTPPPILEDCLANLTPLPQMLPPPPPPPETVANATPGGCNVASPTSGVPLSSAPYAPRERVSSTAVPHGPAQQMPMPQWAATGQQMAPLPPLTSFLAPVLGAQPDFGFVRPKIALPGPPLGCGGPRGAGLGVVNSVNGFR